MTKKEKLNYTNKKPIAVYILGYYGIEILDILYGIDDYIVYKTPNNNIHISKIYYGIKKTTFRTKNYGNIDLSECLKCNY